MTGPMPDNDAYKARRAMRNTDGPSAAQAYATLALAEAIESAARTLARGMVEAARIRAGKRL